MPIRRKSTQQRTPKDCRYHVQMQFERDNQEQHEIRQLDPEHDPTLCWCCCDDCTDLEWFYSPRKGGDHGRIMEAMENRD